MRISKKTLTSLSLLSLVACGPDAPSPVQGQAEPVATAENFLRSERAVPGQYVVVLREDGGEVETVANGLARQHGGEVLQVYQSALRGFSARLSESAARALARDPRVVLVEEDGTFQAEAPPMAPATVQTTSSWGLDRIDQPTLPLNGQFNYVNTGANVNAYIVSTGIRQTHNEFQVNRAHPGYDITAGNNGNDCAGQGTHAAGVVGGVQYGVAKGVHLWAVRVFNCQGTGTTSGIIAALDWVRVNHVAPAVANLQLGGPASAALDTAVNKLITAGVTVVVPAGNSNANACNESPARVPAALTVAASTSTDARATYSNFGSCVDLFAPDTATAAWHTSNTATQLMRNSHVSSAFVTGVVALYLQGNPTATPATVTAAILGNATPGVVTGVSAGTANRLLFTHY